MYASKRVLPTINMLRVSLFLGALVLLLLSWWALFWLIRIETEISLPYDTSWYNYWGWPPDGPPPGSWQRDLNAFLESRFGSILPALLIVGASVALLVITLSRNPRFREKPFPLLLSFAASNLIGAPVILLAFFVGCAATAYYPAWLKGWGQTTVTWLPILSLLILLFALQGWAIPRRLLARSD